MPENLSYQPFSPVPLNGATKLFRCGDAEASLLPLIWQNEDGAETAVEPEPLFVHQLKIRPPPNPFVATESGRSRHGHGLFAADRQALTSLRPASLEDQASVLGAHAYQESVRASAAPFVRLKCAKSLCHDAPLPARISLAGCRYPAPHQDPGTRSFPGETSSTVVIFHGE
jgi:hypothetical protein